MILSAAFTPVITPFYYIPIMLYYGQSRAAQWFLLTLARYKLVQWSTHPNILGYCHLLFHTSFHFFPDVFCLITDKNPSSSCWVLVTAHPLVQACVIQQRPLSHFWNHSCSSASVVLKFHYELQSNLLILSPSFSLFPATLVRLTSNPPPPQTIPSHNHTTQFKQVFRLGPVCVCMCVCVTPLP